MKVAKAPMSEADYEMLFTKDPGYFFEAILVELSFSKNAADAEKLKAMFIKWLGFYAASVREESMTELRKKNQEWLVTQMAELQNQGKLYALTHLPFKPSLIGSDKVDMAAVQLMIEKLKEQRTGEVPF